MSTIHIPRPMRHHGVARRRTAAVVDPGSWALALAGVAALVALPAALVGLSLLLP
ncbi:hypothetical protein AB0L40_05010 [Patulibacter sp. NPDC049589]|uniref:hypothetical protein n=1 Tax=Patulibacter sp. NPDC049589 TaxID=3154731 RepID=UPI00344942C3